MATESFFSSASLALLASAGAGKDGKTYSIKPNDGTGDFTFSRGSNLTATRVGADGLIEKGRENLLLQSNNFESVSWSSSGITETGGQTGYDGSSNAWLLTATSDYKAMSQTVSSSGVNTFSVYLKNDNVGNVLVRVNGSVNAFVGVNLASGTITTESGASFVDSSITPVANGWYRVSITANTTIIGVNVTFNDVAGSSFYIQDAQLEIGLAATDYIESGATTGKAGLLEDEPRFDYSGGATCPSLLLEPSRTNLIAYSEYLTNFNAYSPTSTISVNAAISPEGVQNACEFTYTGSGNDFAYSQPTYTTSGASVFSVYMRVASGTKSVSLRTWNTGVFNAVNVTTEWQRFELNLPSALSNERIGIDNRVTYGGSGTAGVIEVYGAQMEEGSYPTSYIPNHSGGSVTRGVDVCFKTGISSVIGQTEGTLFVDAKWFVGGTGFDLNRSRDYHFSIYINTTNKITLFAEDGVNAAAVELPNQSTNTRYKIAAKYNSTETALFVNGVKIGTSVGLDYSSNNLTKANFGLERFSNVRMNGVNNQFLVFPTALSDEDCIALTTL